MTRIRLKSICTVLFLVTLLGSCKTNKQAGRAGGAVPVLPYTVQTGNIIFYDSYPGTVAATDEVQLRSEVSGFITGIFFKEGSDVTKDSRLYEIDRRKFQAVYEEAKATLDISNANLKKAQRDADRYKKLDEQNAIAKQVLDDAITALENAQLQVRSAKANLVNAETDFNYSIIKAPFAGAIGLSQVKPGAFVTAGQTLLNTISSVDPIAVDFIADEKTLPYLINLQKSQPMPGDSTFKVLLPDNSDYKYNGKLSIIDRAVDPQTGTIRIRTVFPNPERNLRPGMDCKIKVLNQYSGLQVNIPVRALVEQMGEYFVYTIDTANIVRQKRLELGPTEGQVVIVKSGLKPGDKIVLEGLQKVHEGSLVTTSNPMDKNKQGQTEQGKSGPPQEKK